MPSLPRSHSIVGRWVPSAGATGFRLVDRSGRSNHGTLTNMDAASDWVASGGKGALDFDGVNDGVLINSTPPIITNAVTVCLWFNPSRLTRGDLVTRWVSGSDSGDQFNLLYGLSSGKPQFFTAFTVSGATSGTGSSTMATGNWYFLCGRWNGTEVSVWMNGRLESSSSGANTLRSASASQTSIGRNLTTDGYTQGLIDDVTIFNVALTASEIREMYRLGRGYGVFPEPDFDEGFAAAGFKAYWARRQSQLIGGGV